LFRRPPSADERHRPSRHPAHHQAEPEPGAGPARAPGLHPAAAGEPRPTPAATRADAKGHRARTPALREPAPAHRQGLSRRRGAGGRGLPQSHARHHFGRRRPAPLRAPAAGALTGLGTASGAAVLYNGGMDGRNAIATTEPHLLVVDDDARLRELLGRYLVEHGFRVTAAADAAEARAKLAGLDFDLLIIDVMMPGEDGLTLTQRLRATSRIPI